MKKGLNSIFVLELALLSVIAGALIYQALCKKSHPTNERFCGLDPYEKRFGNGTRDLIDEAVWESFPASDPPSSY